MSNTTKTVRLTSRKNDWYELTELVDALKEYSQDTGKIYNAVQQIAEGLEATLIIDEEEYEVFKSHMREFRIYVQ